MKSSFSPDSQRRAVKRRTPLQALLRSVKCGSCADGSILVEVEWQPAYAPCGGVLTRMYAARHLARVINAHLKGLK